MEKAGAFRPSSISAQYGIDNRASSAVHQALCGILRPQATSAVSRGAVTRRLQEVFPNGYLVWVGPEALQDSRQCLVQRREPERDSSMTGD